MKKLKIPPTIGEDEIFEEPPAPKRRGRKAKNIHDSIAEGLAKIDKLTEDCKTAKSRGLNP